ncbi:MAG: hypothetical protein ACLFSU_02200, partial [Acholeplasmataceae bacterium]
IDILAAGDDETLVADVDTNVTIGQLKDLNLLGSTVMDKLITDAIVDAVGEANVPSDAYDDPAEQEFLSAIEVTEMIGVIEVLAEPAVGQDVDDVLVEDVSTVVDNGELQALAASDSVIFKQLITNEIETAITNIPDEAYDDEQTDRLSDDEISEMIQAIDILAAGDDETLVADVDTDVTVDQTEELAVLDSIIIKQLISDEIILFVDPANDGDKVPVDAYEDVDDQRLTDTEIEDMVDALDVLADGVGTTLVRDLSSDITVGQAEALEGNDSLIIQKLISDTIVEELTAARIPESAYIGGETDNNLRPDEVTAIIEVLELLAEPDPGQQPEDVLISDIDIDESTIDVATLDQFPDSDIVNRMMSTAIIDNVDDIPDDSFEVFDTDLYRSEIDYLLDALLILDVETDEADTLGADEITFEELDQIVALGSGEPLGYSPIIVHIISEPLTTGFSKEGTDSFEYGIPSTATQDDNDDLTNDEVLNVVDALKVFGEVPDTNAPETTTIDDALSGVDPTTFDDAVLTDLIDTESLLVYRMISIGIFDAELDNPDAYAEIVDDNYDDELPDEPEYIDIKIAEMEHIALSMNILEISSIGNIENEITLEKLEELSEDEVDDLIEADTGGPNTIIYYMISEVVDPDNDLPFFDDSDYVMEGGERIRLRRSSLKTAILAL